MANITLKLVNPKTLEISDKGDLGLFINGDLVTTYYLNHLPEHADFIRNMLSAAFEYGKKERSAEIRKLIGN